MNPVILSMVCGAIFLIILAGAGPVRAQNPTPPPTPLTLVGAIQFAMEHYPSVREALAHLSGREAGIDLAQTAYLPRVDLGLQASNATFNNVSGLFFPTSIIQPISGADVGRRSFSSTWGSAAGLYLAWEPFDFGLRSAHVDTARAGEHHSRAHVVLTKLEVGMAVGEAYLRVVLAQEALKASQANVDRRQVFAKTVKALVDAQLRPGIDLSRAQAELAVAHTQLIEGEQLEEVGRASLGEVLGVAGQILELGDPALQTLPTFTLTDDRRPSQHPLAVVQQAAVEIPQKRKEALAKAWVPKFTFQSAFYGRGTGWDAQGNRTNGSDGLLPDVPNWAVGLTATFSLLDFPALRAQERQEHYHSVAESARYDRLLQNLTGQQMRAKTLADSAKRIAEHIPAQVKAARDTEIQARAQFKSGLATVVEVAEAQRLVVQAFMDDAKARLGVWRAYMGLAGAHGDLGQFLALVPSPSPSRK